MYFLANYGTPLNTTQPFGPGSEPATGFNPNNSAFS